MKTKVGKNFNAPEPYSELNHGIPPGRWWDNFFGPWGILNFHLQLERGAQPNGGFKIFHTFGGQQQGFLYRENGGSPYPIGEKLFIPPTGKSLSSRLPPPNFYCPYQRFIPPNPTKFKFSIEHFFSEQYHDIKNALIDKVNCNLKLPLNYETHVVHFILI